MQKVEEDQSQVAALQRRIRELEARIEELEEDLENERSQRQKAEKQKADLTKELETLQDQLEEEGGAKTAQVSVMLLCGEEGVERSRKGLCVRRRRDMGNCSVGCGKGMTWWDVRGTNIVYEVPFYLGGINGRSVWVSIPEVISNSVSLF